MTCSPYWRALYGRERLAVAREAAATNRFGYALVVPLIDVGDAVRVHQREDLRK
jgi:hypothetical protein